VVVVLTIAEAATVGDKKDIKNYVLTTSNDSNFGDLILPGVAPVKWGNRTRVESCRCGISTQLLFCFSAKSLCNDILPNIADDCVV